MDKYGNLETLATAMGFSGIGIEFCMVLRSMPASDMIQVATARGMTPDAAAKIPGEFAEFMNGMRALFAPAR